MLTCIAYTSENNKAESNSLYYTEVESMISSTSALHSTSRIKR